MVMDLYGYLFSRSFIIQSPVRVGTGTVRLCHGNNQHVTESGLGAEYVGRGVCGFTAVKL